MFISPMCEVPIGLKDGRTVWEHRHSSMMWDCEKYFIEIKPGFQHDACSVPRLPFVYAKWGDRAHSEGSLHDYTYRKDCLIYIKAEKRWVVGMPRAEADALFCRAILSRGYGGDIAYPMWVAVRVGGWPHYQKHSVDHRFQLDIIFPEAVA
jgi:hypothetical protein